MSTPFTPPAWWLSGTNQNSIPANDNALRFWISQADVDNATTAQPTSPADGQCHIIQTTHTGAQWSAFTPKDLAIFSNGTWYAFAPSEGNKVTVSGSIYVFDSGSWVAAGGGGGGFVESIVPGSGISVDSTDPANPVVSADGGGALSWNHQTADYTISLSDASNAVEMNVASANVLTVPPNSSAAFAIGASVLIHQAGAGLTTISAGAGVSIVKRGSSLSMGGQFALATLVKRSTDAWVLSGDIAP